VLGNKAANTHVAIHNASIEEINNDLNVSLYAARKDAWMIDSSATHHITPHTSDFSSYSKIKGAVHLGDKSTVAQEGVRSVTIKTSEGYTITLSNVHQQNYKKLVTFGHFSSLFSCSTSTQDHTS